MPTIKLQLSARLLALGIMLLACPAYAENRIESVTIISEGTNEVVLAVTYRYDGDHGGNVAISAVMAHDGEASQHFAYRPGQVAKGRHRTRVRLGTSSRAPAVFSTDQIVISMYVGGGEAFLKRRFHFAKTWSQPGASLMPVVQQVVPLGPRLTQLRTQLREARVARRSLQARLAKALSASPGPEINAAGQACAVERRVLPNGALELRYPDGTIRKLSDGRITTTLPDGTKTSTLFMYSQPPTPPTAPPSATHADWLATESERLLGIMRGLVGHDESSIQNYLAKEGTNSTVYERIQMRTEAISWLVAP